MSGGNYLKSQHPSKMDAERDLQINSQERQFLTNEVDGLTLLGIEVGGRNMIENY